MPGSARVGRGVLALGAWKDKLLADPTLLMEAYLANAQAQSAFAHA